jgi:hypothetical protein
MTDKLILRFSTSENSLANWASAAIRRLNHSPFSHVDFVLPDGNLLGASDQGPLSPFIIGNPQGVAIRPPGYQRFGIRRDLILDTPLADAVITRAVTQLGKPFDSSSLWDFLADTPPGERDWRNVSHWFCAEHAVWSCEQGGIFAPITLLAWPKNRVSPTDLLMIFLQDERWINRDTFWEPIPGLKLDPGEK